VSAISSGRLSAGRRPRRRGYADRTDRRNRAHL